MLNYDGPVLLDVHVKRDENCYPMVEPGKANSQMLGLQKQSPDIPKKEIVICNNCGTRNPADNHFCPECGSKL